MADGVIVDAAPSAIHGLRAIHQDNAERDPQAKFSVPRDSLDQP
jgi:hypothetical protein